MKLTLQGELSVPKTTCKSFWIAGATALVLLMGQTVSATENKNVMFVLDASNSMWGQIDGKAKIEIAAPLWSLQAALIVGFIVP